MKAKKLIVLTLCAILLGSTFACGSGGGEGEEYLLYTDEDNRFSILYPEDWVKYPEELLEEFVLVSFWSTSLCGEEGPSFRVRTDEVPPATSIQTFFEAVKRALGDWPEYTPISEEELSVGGRPAIKHVYTYVAQAGTISVMLLILVEGTTGWSIFCFSPSACWSQYESSFDKIVDSFQLLQQVTPTPTPMSYSIYTDEDNGFSISYPEEWDILPEELWGPLLVRIQAPSSCAGDIPCFNVLNVALHYPMSVQTFNEANTRQLSANVPGYTLISEEELTVGGRPAIKHVYTDFFEEESGITMQVSLVEGTKAWVISCFSVPVCWSQYESIFDTIAASFQLLE
ncbi:hypothetical protein ES703_31282 [subsurface metagenome]